MRLRENCPPGVNATQTTAAQPTDVVEVIVAPQTQPAALRDPSTTRRRSVRGVRITSLLKGVRVAGTVTAIATSAALTPRRVRESVVPLVVLVTRPTIRA